jgi:hypothetical protein
MPDAPYASGLCRRLPAADNCGMRRHVVGILAIGFLAAAAALLIWPVVDATFWLGVALRLGIVLGAMWLAWPQLARLPAWLAAVVLVVAAAAVLLARHKLTLLVVTAALLIAAVVRPRTRSQPPR